jgi:predicted membrane protein
MFRGVFHDNAVIFSKKDITVKSNSDDKNQIYTVFCGDTVIDLTQIDLSKESVEVEINVVLGQANVILKKGMPVQITTEAVFGEARLPDENFVTFGGLKHSSPEAATAQKMLKIKSQASFGSIRYSYKE